MSAAAELREALIAACVAGELDPRSEEGRRALAAAGVDEAELAPLLALARRLDAASEEREAVAREAALLAGDAPGSERVAETVHRLARSAARDAPPTALRPAGESAEAERRQRARRLLLAAAALLFLPLAIQLARWALPAQDVPADVRLGAERVRVETPLSVADGVRWHVAEPTAHDVFRVVVRAGAADGPLVADERVEGRTWWRPGRELDAAPGPLYVQVQRLDPAGGTPERSPWAVDPRR